MNQHCKILLENQSLPIWAFTESNFILVQLDPTFENISILTNFFYHKYSVNMAVMIAQFFKDWLRIHWEMNDARVWDVTLLLSFSLSQDSIIGPSTGRNSGREMVERKRKNVDGLNWACMSYSRAKKEDRQCIAVKSRENWPLWTKVNCSHKWLIFSFLFK